MTTPVWQAGTIYAPGSLVQPASAIAPVADQVTNGGFEDGNTGWSLATGFSIGQFGNGTHFQGTWSLQWDLTGTGRAINTNATDVVPGQTINANCQVQQGASSEGQAGARAEIAWYDSSDELISYSMGNLVQSGSNQHWKQSTVAGVAPAGAAFARFSVYAFRTSGGDELWVDNCTWDALVSTLPTGLVFRAVQAVAGYSGATEPVWPVVNGQQVVDNEVTWEAVYASRVVWQAAPVLESGSYEPEWPDAPDATVADGTIKWVAMNFRVQDEKCPHSKVVAIAASKIFAADEDIIPFSATTNPLDWSSEADAGYLPFGLNTYGSTPVSAMGLYRSNLIAFNSEGYQMWQVDQDPANMALLDASPVDCIYRKSIQAVMNDLAFLSSQGVRNIGIAGASTNLQAGAFGKQVDPLVLAKIRAGLTPISLFFPGAGQYWLIFGDEAFVLTINSQKDQSWSRYVFPEAITDFAILAGVLYLRTENDNVWQFNAEALKDDEYIPENVTVTPVVNECEEDFDSVALLLNCDGADGSTDFEDLSVNDLVVTATGTTQVDTATPKFGTGAAAISGGGALTVPIVADGPLDLPSDGDFTVEFWARSPVMTSSPMVLLALGNRIGGNGILIAINGGNLGTAVGGVGTWGGFNGNPAGLADDTWIHFALVRNGDVGTLYVNGTAMSGTTSSWTGSSQHVSGTCSFGQGFGEPFYQAFSGQMDEIRITKGVARYTSNFTPPTEAFPASPCTEVPVVVGETFAVAEALIEAADLVVGSITYELSDTVPADEIISQDPAAEVVTGEGSTVAITVSVGPSIPGEPFEGYIAWPYLDFGAFGLDKMLESVDVTATGEYSISIGYSQTNFNLATTPYTVDGDTLPGSPVPIPVMGPSFQLRLTFSGEQDWEWMAANMYLNRTVMP